MSAPFGASPEGDGSSARPLDESVAPVHAIDLLSANFDKIDKNRDGSLSTNEIKNVSATNPTMSRRDQLTIEAFAPAVVHVQTASNDKWGFDIGVTQNDLKALKQYPEKHQDAIAKLDEGLAGTNLHDKRAIGALLTNSFGRMDTNKDGYLSETEIETFRDDRENPTTHRDMAAFVLDHYKEFRGLVNETGFSREEGHGPFRDGYGNKSADALSFRDASAFNNYLARPENFERYINSMRTEEIAMGIGQGLLYGSLSAAAGLYTAATPEPLTKVPAGMITASLAGLSALNFYKAYAGHTDEVRQQYETRRKMIDSWQQFQKPHSD